MSVELLRTYPSPATAEGIAKALAADNPSYVGVSVDGASLRIGVVASSAASARTTLEDLVACVQVAERTLGVIKTSGRPD